MRRLALVIVALAAAIAAVAMATRAPADPACVSRRFEGARFTVCTYDPARDTLRIVTHGANGARLRRLTDLKRDLGDAAASVRFAMNAGMYDADGAPIGLLVQDSVQQHALNTASGDGNFHLKPNGVFYVAPDGAHVRSSEAYLALNTTPIWATQSGPMLVIDGAMHPAIQADGPSRNVRNGVGECPQGVVFVLSEEAVSFGRFARFFRDELGCANALYLDGFVSSLWRPETGRLDDRVDLGPMIVVTRAPKAVAPSTRSD